MMRRSLSSCTWDERRAGRMKRSSFEKRFTSSSLSGRRVPDETCVNSFVGAGSAWRSAWRSSPRQLRSGTHSPRTFRRAVGHIFCGKACSLEAGWRCGGLWKCFSTTDHTRRCPRGTMRIRKMRTLPSSSRRRLSNRSRVWSMRSSTGRRSRLSGRLGTSRPASSRFIPTLGSLSNCRSSRGSADALAQFSCNSAYPARDQLADLPEPQHRARNRGTEHPVLWAQAHSAECALKKWRVDDHDLEQE